MFHQFYLYCGTQRAIAERKGLKYCILILILRQKSYPEGESTFQIFLRVRIKFFLTPESNKKNTDSNCFCLRRVKKKTKNSQEMDFFCPIVKTLIKNFRLRRAGKKKGVKKKNSNQEKLIRVKKNGVKKLSPIFPGVKK